MNATRILWGQVLLVSFVVLAFLWGATEWVAWRLAFQCQFGRPWFEVFGWPLYQPPAFFWWWFAYDAYAREVFTEGAYIAASGGIATVIVAIAMSVWRAREMKRVTTYGSARWAETGEVGEAGLGHDGVLLGQWRDQYLRHDGPEHVLCFAPTRRGTGVGLVVPTLLTWPGSAIVHDIKGENWTLTAGWRAKFGRVLLFDPTNAGSSAYNPLLEVRRGEWRSAMSRTSPTSWSILRAHWSAGTTGRRPATRCWWARAILHVLYAESDKTLAGVANFGSVANLAGGGIPGIWTPVG
jgi:type IV secretion system protein VirD4